jgi:hypothetical protein
MNVLRRVQRERQSLTAPVVRHLLTFYLSLACLLAVLPAARAHDDDESPTPEHIFWGTLFFALALMWLAFVSYHMSYPARKRRRIAQNRREPLPRWLRWLARDQPAHPPRNASRQVRRAFYRKRR